MKLKRKAKLLPSARDNRRYLTIDASQSEKDKIERSILDYIGILGMAKSAFMFVESERLIGSCRRESIEDIRAALAFGKFKVKKVSGTISGLDRE